MSGSKWYWGQVRMLIQTRLGICWRCWMGASVLMLSFFVAGWFFAFSAPAQAVWRGQTQTDASFEGSRVVSSAQAVTKVDASTTPIVLPRLMLPDFTVLVERVGPAVVNIRTTQKVFDRTGAGEDVDDEIEELFRRFFGHSSPGLPKKRQRSQPRSGDEEEIPRGVGSGFIVGSEGWVMTNAHVVDGAEHITVALTDKREFKAKLVGLDKRTDVAVLKIDAKELPTLQVGDVAHLKVGEWVLAIGSPFGLDNTVTAGIVSAKQRDTGEYLPFIQTDVAVNPGNSGGPLINMQGEVIGINSQIYSRTGSYAGVSFAIPIDEAIRVAEQIRSTGKVARGRLGIQIGQVSKEIAESIGLGKEQGALVRSVEAGSPAQKAGIQAGDIVVTFDGKTIEKASDLPRLVGNTKPGSTKTLIVFRRGDRKNIQIVVGQNEEESAASQEKNEGKSKEAGPLSFKRLGLRLQSLSADQKKHLQGRGGLVVESVQGPAARVGIRPGDFILLVANQEVSQPKDVERILAKLPKTASVSLLVARDDLVQFVLVRPIQDQDE
jgi:serine protease Do